MLKKMFTIAFLVLLVVALAACGGSTDSDTTVDQSQGGGENSEQANESEGQEGGEEIDSIVIGFVPSQDADTLADTAKPLADKLGEILGVPVEAQVMTDYVGLVEAMRTQNVDIGFLNPFGFVQGEKRAGAKVILKSVRDGEDSYRAQFNVRADSEIESVEDLLEMDGLVWAYPDTLATAGYLFPASHLMDMGEEDLDSHFEQMQTGGYDNALIALLDGQADFATTFEDARDIMVDDYPDVMDDIRVLGYTDPIPNDTISVRSELDDEWVDKIREAILSFNDDEEMLDVLFDIYSWTGITEAKSEDYDIVRTVFERFEDQLED